MWAVWLLSEMAPKADVSECSVQVPEWPECETRFHRAFGAIPNISPSGEGLKRTRNPALLGRWRISGRLPRSHSPPARTLAALSKKRERQHSIGTQTSANSRFLTHGGRRRRTSPLPCNIPDRQTQLRQSAGRGGIRPDRWSWYSLRHRAGRCEKCWPGHREVEHEVIHGCSCFCDPIPLHGFQRLGRSGHSRVGA